MQTTLIRCKSKTMFDAVAHEMTDWTSDYIVNPCSLEFIIPQCHIGGARLFLQARNINTKLLAFYATEDA